MDDAVIEPQMQHERSAEAGVSRRVVLQGLLCTAAGVVGYAVANRNVASGPRPYGPAAGASRPRRLVSVDQLPEGGGLVLSADGVVVTRNDHGDVHAFSAMCTHQGCTVGGVANDVIVCPCHGSRFDASTGAVINGPATRPLPQVPVVARAGEVYSA